MQYPTTPYGLPSGEALRSLSEVKDCLRPATYGCPDCGTMQMVASPTPIGNCPDCGAAYQMYS